MNLFEVMEMIRTERITRRSFSKDLNKISDVTEINNNSGGNLEKIKSTDGKDIDSIIEDEGDVTGDISDVDKLLIELKKNEPTSDNQFYRLAIITYEMGDLNRSIVYAERFKDDEKAKIAYLANGKLALSDALTQLHLLCQTIGWNFNQLRKLGAEHLKERQEDFKRQGWKDIK